MSGCSICGRPLDDVDAETHHDNTQRGDNSRENLRDVHRRCHMHHHDNDDAVDGRSTERYGPRRANTSPYRPSPCDHPMP